MLGNLHTHTNFSDGSFPPESYLEAAGRAGLSVLGFSDHSPVPLPNEFAIPNGQLPAYVEAISKLKKRRKREEGTGKRDGMARNEVARHDMGGRRMGTKNGLRMGDCGSGIEVLLGLEYDYIPELSGSIRALRESFPFDYIIGSVHLVRNVSADHVWFIDGPNISSYDSGLAELFDGNIRKAVTAYWHQLQEMIGREKPDIIGHLDKVKMHNKGRFFREDEPWYRALVTETLQLIKTSGAVVEVNTRGLYKHRADTLFPGPEILKQILSLKIPVNITSDAHVPEELSLCFPEAIILLKELGFPSHWMLSSGGWKEIPL